MAYIEYPDESKVAPATREALDRYRRPSGELDNVVRTAGDHPAALAAHMQLYRALVFAPSPLTRGQREMLAVVVSRANDCHY